jgi:hypothetical protein
MPEKTKPEREKKRPDGEKIPPQADENSWSRAERESSYYYDDAHGYKIYRPEEDEEEETTD